MVAACPFPAPRGTPIRAYRMAQSLAARGHEVHVVTYHLGQGDDQFPFHIHRIGNVLGYRKMAPGPSYRKLLWVDLKLAFKLREILNTGHFDVIHAHHYEGLIAALMVKRLFQIPIIFDAHTLLESELPYYPLGIPKWAVKRIGRALDSRLTKRADHVIAVSDDIRNKLMTEHGVLANEMSVIPNGVEEEFYVTRNAPMRTGDESEFTLVYAGNLSSYQGIDLLLCAFAKVLEQRKNVRLRIISKSSFTPYEMLAAELAISEHIELVSARLEDLPRLLSEADIALNPRTDCDGLPQKLLNYMASGSAIVSFAGSAKFLSHEQRGLIVENGDVNAFAAAILRLLENPQLANKIAYNAREFVRNELTWSKNAKRTETVYKSLILH